MRLMMVARRFPPDVLSGSETVFEALWREAREKHDVRLVVGWVRDRSMIPADALGVDLRGRRKGLAHLAMWRAASQEARRFRPDVVLSNSIEVPRTSAPTACIVHDLNFGRREGDRSVVREAFYRWQARRLDKLVTPSHATRDALARIGVPDDRIETIANGVDLERFRPADVEKEPGKVEIAYPGRILPGKGQHVAIDAVARLRSSDKKRVVLRISGAVTDRIYFDQLRIQAFQQPVTFATDLPDLAPAYQRADLVLFPTLMREGFGYTAVEAMACGRPVAWSDQAAIREATGGIGFPVPPDDALALKDVIERLLKDPEPFRKAGEDGRRFVEQRYAWPAVWKRYEAMLEALA